MCVAHPYVRPNYPCTSHLEIDKSMYLSQLSLRPVFLLQFDGIFISSIFVRTASSQLLTPSDSDPTDPALFLSVLLYADLTGEEMFCLILNCEEICGQSAKSHYSPPCSAVLHRANQGKRKKQQTERECPYSLRRGSD